MDASKNVVKGVVPIGIRRFYEFGQFRLDRIKRRLSCDGKVVSLYPKAVETLIILVEHSGEILEREALINALWPDTMVEESNLTVAISHLRKVLGQNGMGLAEFIQTIPRVGYRFIADVREVAEDLPSLISEGDRQSTLCSEDSGHYSAVCAEENGAAVSGEDSPQGPEIIAPTLIEQRPLPSKTNWLLIGAVSAIAIACLLLAIAVNVLLRERSSVPQSGVPKPEKSVAVLPFENLSNDREDAFFADGVQDDLLTKLANIAELKVVSRTSVMQYRGERNIREIGDALRVSHVLEGSVRKTGAWLHINAQLIDTRTDSNMWAKQYDGDLKDLFAVQSDIAQKVAEHLHAKLSKAERTAIERPPTADLSAFNLYSHAKSLVLDWNYSPNGKENLLQAVDLLNQAVAHDPTFFQAYCQLAWVHDQLYHSRFDRTPARLALAEGAIDAAFRLRPDAGEVHLARAGHLYRGYNDYDGALGELDFAQKTLPNDPKLFELNGYIERRLGRWEDAVRNLERAIDLDPRNALTLQQTSICYNALRRYADEEAILDRLIALKSNNPEMKVSRASVEFDWKANTHPLHQTIDEIRAQEPAAIEGVAESWLTCALAERDALAAANALTALGGSSVGDNIIKLSPRLMDGIIARMAKDAEKARSAFTAAREEQEKIVNARPDDSGALCVLALIDAGLGRREEALREGGRAVELLPIERDAINGPRMMKCSAIIAAWVGEKDLACDQLAVALRYPGSPSYGELKLLPFWDPLRGDSRFEAIVASLAPK
jgi:TolB-like protein/DNA-binding winged helix-turn-helix (wHTH) protein/Flp pilus assembly protein TadD